MKFVVMSLASLALVACATAQAPAPHDAPHPSDLCVLLSVAKDGATDTILGQTMQARLRDIHTTDLPRPVQQCGDASYQTDPSQHGLTFLAAGFSGDHRYAAVKLQSVAGPLAGEGYTCLYEAADQSWTLRGCQMDWIS
ncbi:MAG: hypothetical protein QM759_03750 [Terricaulis sp.]